MKKLFVVLGGLATVPAALFAGALIAYSNWPLEPTIGLYVIIDADWPSYDSIERMLGTYAFAFNFLVPAFLFWLRSYRKVSDSSASTKGLG